MCKPSLHVFAVYLYVCSLCSPQYSLSPIISVCHACMHACSVEVMDKASSRFRIGMMFGLMGTVTVAAVFTIRAGKKEKAQRIERFVDNQQQNKEK